MMNDEERFYFNVQVLKDINPSARRKNILIEGTTILWAGEKIERLEKELEYFKEKSTKHIDEIEECRQILANGVDRNKDPKDTLRILCNVAVNGIYWRDRAIENLTISGDELWELINVAADKAIETNNNWITLREMLKASRESKE